MRSDNVRGFINEYNISHDTFYTWKKNLTEQAKLKLFRAEMILNNISDEFKEKMPLKRFRFEVVKEVEKLQYINLEEACEALQIAVETLRKWKREPQAQKKNQ